jgi:hypothetical protein
MTTLTFGPFVASTLIADHATATEMNLYRVRCLATTALLHYDRNMATLVRYSGGLHVGAQGNVDKILANIEKNVNPTTKAQLRRILTEGSPTLCNAHSTATNFHSFRCHGNHKSAVDNPKKLLQTFRKETNRGFVLAFDIAILPFVMSLHSTPQGLVDLDNMWKSDRPIFDSLFHPHPSKYHEPGLEFPTSVMDLLVWIWNLRISYPLLKMLLRDNDITGAFRLVKYNAQLISMHCYNFCNRFLGAATGSTFGNCTSPHNFEVFAIARKEHASYLWEIEPEEMLKHASEFVSQMVLPDKATPLEWPTFAQAKVDELSKGVIRPDGSRLPPPYPDQVDDCLFTNIIGYMKRTSSVSLSLLPDVFGDPHPCIPTLFPNPSWISSTTRFTPWWDTNPTLAG